MFGGIKTFSKGPKGPKGQFPRAAVAIHLVSFVVWYLRAGVHSYTEKFWMIPAIPAAILVQILRWALPCKSVSSNSKKNLLPLFIEIFDFYFIPLLSCALQKEKWASMQNTHTQKETVSFPTPRTESRFPNSSENRTRKPSKKFCHRDKHATPKNNL